MASKCSACGEVRLPPRTYCLQCYGRTRVDVELFHLGRIAALSTAHLDRVGNRLASPSRTTFGYVTFEGVEGGLAHKIEGNKGREPRAGDPVRASFLPPEHRKGSVLDIACFRVSTSR